MNIFVLLIRFIRYLDQDVLIKTIILVLVVRLQGIFKTFSRRLQDVLSRRLHNVFKKSSRRFEDVFRTSTRRFQNFFKTSPRHLQDVFKMSSGHLQDVLKTYHLVKLFLSTNFQDVLETYSKCFWDVLQKGLSIEVFAYVTLLRNLSSVYKICKSDKSFSNISFSL